MGRVRSRAEGRDESVDASDAVGVDHRVDALLELGPGEGSTAGEPDEADELVRAGLAVVESFVLAELAGLGVAVDVITDRQCARRALDEGRRVRAALTTC